MMNVEGNLRTAEVSASVIKETMSTEIDMQCIRAELALGYLQHVTGCCMAGDPKNQPESPLVGK